jgi:hypothetical protein
MTIKFNGKNVRKNVPYCQQDSCFQGLACEAASWQGQRQLLAWAESTAEPNTAGLVWDIGASDLWYSAGRDRGHTPHGDMEPDRTKVLAGKQGMYVLDI